MKNTGRNRILWLLPVVLTSGCLMPSGWDSMHWSVSPQQAGDPAVGANPGVENPYGNAPLQGLPPANQGYGAPGALPPGAEPALPAAKLYSWDGTVIEGQNSTGGSMSMDDSVPAARPRGVEPSLAGRMHIIELYQEVLDERDALAEEVQGLTSALEKSQAQHSEKDGSRDMLLQRITELEGSLAQMRRDYEEMGARLTTAQIRRLEAEKLLLETRIENERRDQAEETEAP